MSGCEAAWDSCGSSVAADGGGGGTLLLHHRLQSSRAAAAARASHPACLTGSTRRRHLGVSPNGQPYSCGPGVAKGAAIAAVTDKAAGHPHTGFTLALHAQPHRAGPGAHPLYGGVVPPPPLVLPAVGQSVSRRHMCALGSHARPAGPPHRPLVLTSGPAMPACRAPRPAWGW